MARYQSTGTYVSTIEPISQLPKISQKSQIGPPERFLPSQTSNVKVESTIITKSPSSSNRQQSEIIPPRNTYDTEKITPEVSESPIVEDLTPITEISPALAMTDSELACYHAVRYILRYHKQLTENDIQYASNYISSFYSNSYDSHSYDSLQENPEADNVLNDEQLVLFLVYADQRGIGKLALTFNEELDAAIKAKDTISLKKILLGPKEMFIELYDNPYISNEDREFVIRLISREMFAATLALGLLKKKILNLETIDDKCTSETLTFEAQKDSGVVNIAVLATKCYDEVCIQDAKILEDDQVRAIMSQREKTSESVYTVDKPQNSSTPQVYCFNTIDLITAMTDDIPINPKSKEPFSDYALKVIRQRFSKEISMYRRYKEIKSQGHAV